MVREETKIEIELQNFRTIGMESVKLTIQPGITALIGPNDAGKSNFFRFLFAFRPLFATLSNEVHAASWLQHRKQLSYLPKQNPSETTTAGVPSTWFNNSAYPMEFTVRVGGFSLFARLFANEANNHIAVLDSENDEIGAPPANALSLKRSSQSSLLPAGLTDAFALIASMKYIPSFRAPFVGYGQGGINYDYKFGLTLTEFWRRFRTGGNQEFFKKSGQLVETLRELLGLDQIDVTVHGDQNDPHLHFESRKSLLHPLIDSGTGVTQIFSTLCSIVESRTSYLLIDEPEIGMHPQLQLRFVECLQGLCECGIVMTTHSLALARSSAQHLVTVDRTPPRTGVTRISTFDAKPTMAQFLGEMSYSSYHELGFDKVLFVEGKHDVPIFRHWLRLYSLDHEVMVLPLGGSSGIPPSEDDLREATRICPNLYLVIDSEKSAETSELPSDRKQTKLACDAVGVHLHILHRRATENYFPNECVTAEFPKARQLSAFERADDVWKKPEIGWNKKSNPRIGCSMEKEHLEETDIGAFLRSLALEVKAT